MARGMEFGGSGVAGKRRPAAIPSKESPSRGGKDRTRSVLGSVRIWLVLRFRPLLFPYGPTALDVSQVVWIRELDIWQSKLFQLAGSDGFCEGFVLLRRHSYADNHRLAIISSFYFDRFRTRGSTSEVTTS